ncbi:uncharacterized protein LOC128246054 [Mya arenaria]|uniref:uncharacterized protein LOC128246054 n=1 Tax=Mya arenaria TaxID=6604 RepID=UPI0022E38E8A|nr:uncharacterized protein LOC128246054 [Mya arenaria]
MPEHSRLNCRACHAFYPNVNIVKCCSRVLGEISFCESCHRRYHPACNNHVSAVRHEDRKCDSCLAHEATVVCPMCTGRLTPVQLCRKCSEQIHIDLYLCHLDHVFSVSS